MYMLKRIGNGWQCRKRNSTACGWGSRPDLAIRDWALQHKLSLRAK